MYVASAQIIEGLMLGLTAQERWKAAGRFNTNFAVSPLFVISGSLIIVLLIIILVIINIKRRENPGRRKVSYFLELSAKRGLSYHESQLLLHISRLAGLKQPESIFTMNRAFDVGASRMTGPNSAMTLTPEQNKQLVRELVYLREKLGFVKTTVPDTVAAAASEKPSSRNVPVGKTVQMTRRINNNSMDIEATVVKNDEIEFTVKLDIAVGAKMGEMWRVRYYYGASVWEFDVSVKRCESNYLVLTHSDSIRFINRRRFLRVSVYKKAYVAPFSFERQVFKNDDKPDSPDSGDAFDTGAAIPQFVPGAVTELAGPGLRLETNVEFKPGQRVAVIFDLGIYDPEEDTSWETGEMTTTEIIEDIGIVRHVQPLEKGGWSIAIELTALSDSNINKLVRATNAEAAKAHRQTKSNDNSSAKKPVEKTKK